MAPLEIEMYKLIPSLPFDTPTTFDQASTIAATNDPSIFTALLQPDWAYGPNIHGGYLISIILKAAVVFANATVKVQQSVTSWSTQFLSSASPGPATINVSVLRLSPGQSTLRAQLLQPSNEILIDSTLHLSPSTSSAPLSKQRTLTLPIPPQPSLPFASLHLPPSAPLTEPYLLAQSWQYAPLADYLSYYTSKPYIRVFMPPDSNVSPPSRLAAATSLPHPILGPTVRDTFFLNSSASGWTSDTLPVLLDLFAPLHYNFPQGKGFFITTQSISCEVRSKPTSGGWTWLFGREELRDCRDGKYIVDVTVYDERGTLVAIARHVNVVIPINRLMSSGKRRDDATQSRKGQPTESKL